MNDTAHSLLNQCDERLFHFHESFSIITNIHCSNFAIFGNHKAALNRIAILVGEIEFVTFHTPVPGFIFDGELFCLRVPFTVVTGAVSIKFNGKHHCAANGKFGGISPHTHIFGEVASAN